MAKVGLEPIGAWAETAALLSRRRMRMGRVRMRRRRSGLSGPKVGIEPMLPWTEMAALLGRMGRRRITGAREAHSHNIQ